jgi:hypothetical protein
LPLLVIRLPVLSAKAKKRPKHRVNQIRVRVALESSVPGEATHFTPEQPSFEYVTFPQLYLSNTHDESALVKDQEEIDGECITELNMLIREYSQIVSLT